MNWKLTQKAVGHPEIDQWSDGSDDEDLNLGYSLMRALAESDHTLVEVAPGVWRHAGTDEDRSWH